MACDREMIVLISCFADGEATPEEASRAKAHLEQCAGCRALVADWSEQRRVFEWAYAIPMPEAPHVEWSQTPAAARGGRSVVRNSLWLPLRARRSWIGAGVAVATFVAGVIVYRQAVLPTSLETGAALATTGRYQEARVGGDVLLRIGPDSEVRRIDAGTIRLERGWVTASVRHGTGFRVQSRRIEVRDQGTLFRVGTGPRMDYVVVDEGSVYVSKGSSDYAVASGQVLMASDNEKPLVASLPKPRPEEAERSIPLDGSSRAFTPSSPDQLDWDAGLQRLASVRPGLRVESDTVNAYSTSIERCGYRIWVAAVRGLTDGLQAHFGDIAQAVAGGDADSGGWEIPVAIVRLDGITTAPELPADTYLLRLVSTRGRLAWRLSGSTGAHADYPFSIDRPHASSSGYNDSAAGPIRLTTTSFPSQPRLTMTLRFTDWPGEIGPALNLDLRGIPMAESEKDKLAMLSQVIRTVGRSSTLDLRHGMSDLLYLDSSRRHRLLIAWNAEAGRQLCRLSDYANAGRVGSVVLGVVSTDSRLNEPSAEPGTYLLVLALPRRGSKPHLEIATPDGRAAASGSAPSHALLNRRSTDHATRFSAWAPESLPGHKQIVLSYALHPAEGDSFAFRFMVQGRPDSGGPVKTGSDTSARSPSSIWAEGCIRVSTP